MSDVPDLSSDEEHYEDDDWQEMESSETSVTCLFCENIFKSVDECLKHCVTSHNFKLNKLKAKFNMDCYSYIKLVNYVKTKKPSSIDIMSADRELWDSEVYLKPVHNDEWLMYDFDSLTEPSESPKTYHANVENGLVTLSQAHFIELQRTINTLTRQLQESEEHLKMAREDMDKMKRSMSSLVDGCSNSSGDVNCVAKVPIDMDEGYFNSYAHFGIHYEMLSDKIRTMSYRDAIINNKDTIKGKIVLDLGCGTGILSMFAAEAGAKKVYALDQSEVIYHAMDIIRENNLENTITAVKGRLEDTKLDSKVDVIVSEWMGYFLLFEGMLDSVIYARDNCLTPGGLLLPNRCNISLVANGDIETHNKLIDFWSDIYGFKMNCMKSEVVREASIDVVQSKYILTDPCVVKDIDIYTCDIDVMNFTSDFQLPVTKDGSVTSLIGYFDTFFDLEHKISFSTGPNSIPTHWKQTVFYFKDCKSVKKGDVIKGSITCSRLKTDVRGLAVQINVFGKQHKFILS